MALPQSVEPLLLLLLPQPLPTMFWLTTTTLNSKQPNLTLGTRGMEKGKCLFFSFLVRLLSSLSLSLFCRRVLLTADDQVGPFWAPNLDALSASLTVELMRARVEAPQRRTPPPPFQVSCPFLVLSLCLLHFSLLCYWYSVSVCHRQNISNRLAVPGQAGSYSAKFRCRGIMRALLQTCISNKNYCWRHTLAYRTRKYLTQRKKSHFWALLPDRDRLKKQMNGVH